MNQKYKEHQLNNDLQYKVISMTPNKYVDKKTLGDMKYTIQASLY